MKRIAILTANLGNFDTPVDPVKQILPDDVGYTFHRFDDKNFPPIAGLTPRLQYRIPKMFGWQMYPGYDYYIWLDGSMSFTRPDSAKWFLDKCQDYDMALFKHPYRNTIQEETDHIEEYLKKKDKYITPRYENGLHKEQLNDIKLDVNYVDDHLFTSTAFIYRDSEEVRNALRLWWLHTSRYFTVDQIALPYVVKDLQVNTITENQYKVKYLTEVSKHK